MFGFWVIKYLNLILDIQVYIKHLFIHHLKILYPPSITDICTSKDLIMNGYEFMLNDNDPVLTDQYLFTKIMYIRDYNRVTLFYHYGNKTVNFNIFVQFGNIKRFHLNKVIKNGDIFDPYRIGDSVIIDDYYTDDSDDEFDKYEDYEKIY